MTISSAPTLKLYDDFMLEGQRFLVFPRGIHTEGLKIHAEKAIVIILAPIKTEEEFIINCKQLIVLGLGSCSSEKGALAIVAKKIYALVEKPFASMEGVTLSAEMTFHRPVSDKRVNAVNVLFSKQMPENNLKALRITVDVIKDPSDKISGYPSDKEVRAFFEIPEPTIDEDPTGVCAASAVGGSGAV